MNTDFFCTPAAKFDAIAAPDKGASTWAHDIANICKKEFIQITKKRPAQERVNIVSTEGNVAGKKVLLVDDIISTGRTITQCADTLKQLGATSVVAAITHGIFSPGSYQLIEQSPLERIYVTNSIVPHGSCEKVTIVDISQFIQNIMQNPKKP